MRAVSHNQSLFRSDINKPVVRNGVEDGSNTENVKAQTLLLIRKEN